MTAKPRTIPLAILLALTMIAAACGGGSDDADTSADGGTTTGAEETGTESGQAVTVDAEGDLATGQPQVTEQAEDAMEEEAAEAPEAATSDAATDEAAMDSDAMADDESAGLAAAPEGRLAADVAEDGAASGGFFGQEPTVEQPGDNRFEDYGIRPFVETVRDPLSTFALDVDTASYSIARQWLTSGQTPPRESVRVEEYVNSFDYDYRPPSEGLNVQADGGPSPFDDRNVIVRIGVQAEQVANADRPDAALTFVVDTSGSMDRANRLALVRQSLTRLATELDGDDSVAIVTYSDDARVVLPPTSVAELDTILDAIDSLRPTGSTNLEAGLQRGYDLANESFLPGGINRVVLASDGVANVGLVDPDGLAALIRGDADRGIQLVTVGVGMGNFNDVVLEQLANQGDGFYAYVNDEREADRLFSDDLVSTLLTVAIDGKIQVEFNDDVVERYRLIGFENRAVLDDDFRNDEVDAGELGAGHQVTALYELELRPGAGAGDELGLAQLRWEDPEERSVRELRLALTADIIEERWADTADDFRLAVTAAAFAEILRDSPHRGDVTLTQVADEADALTNGTGPAAELADLARLAFNR